MRGTEHDWSRLGSNMGTEQPNPISVGISVLRAMRVSRPAPHGQGVVVDHAGLKVVLATLAAEGVRSLPGQREEIAAYRVASESVDPDSLDRSEALAYWLNLYNSGALDAAAHAVGSSATSVLRVPGAFSKPWVSVAGERLSLNDIEHGKIRRFGDPRIHGALVCGSASCPTLRYEPYTGAGLEKQLDAQMRSFLAGGGAHYDSASQQLMLSRIFLWYGADFVRPHRMPAWIPATKTAIVDAIGEWLDDEISGESADASVAFQSYDWGLACSIG